MAFLFQKQLGSRVRGLHSDLNIEYLLRQRPRESHVSLFVLSPSMRYAPVMAMLSRSMPWTFDCVFSYHPRRAAARFWQNTDVGKGRGLLLKVSDFNDDYSDLWTEEVASE